MSTTSATAPLREELEARHDLVGRIREELARLDALVEELWTRVPRARIETGMVTHLGAAELDVIRSGLEDPTFADPGRARIELARAAREREALLDLTRRLGAASACRPPASCPSAVRAEPPPFAAQALGASAGTSRHCVGATRA